MNPEDVLLAVSLSVVVLSLAGYWLLRRPASWLSRWLDRQVDDAVRLPRAEP